MDTLFAYLAQTQAQPLQGAILCAVDALALARLSNAPFDGLVPQDFGKERTTIKQACQRLLSNAEARENLLLEDDVRFLTLMGDSRRFGGLELCGFRNQADEKTDKQFAALCIPLADEGAYLSFRGTDDTLNGWKENFDMSFLMAVPAQISAAEYVAEAARYFSGTLLCGGHSKGGNLAVYGAAFCPPEIQSKIGGVYNFDGPGFTRRVIEQQGYQSIVERVETFVPQSSVVGMLLEHEEDYTIIHSGQKGLLQHDPYSWEIKGNEFVTLKTTTETSRLTDETIKDWLAQLSCSQREEFIEALFTVLDQTGAKTVRELSKNWYKSAGAALKSMSKLDGDMRKAVLYALWALIKSVAENLLEELTGMEW